MTFKMFKKIIYLGITLYMYILNKMNLKIIKQSLLKLFDWIKANTAKIKKRWWWYKFSTTTKYFDCIFTSQPGNNLTGTMGIPSITPYAS